MLKGANFKSWSFEQPVENLAPKPEIGSAGPVKRHNGGQRRTRGSKKEGVKMKVVNVLGLGLVAALFASPAAALTVTNNDSDAVTINVIVDGEGTEQSIEPGASVEPACEKGCVIELESGDQYEMKGDEDASIEDGALYVDEAPGVPEDEYPNVDTPDSDQPESDAPADAPQDE